MVTLKFPPKAQFWLGNMYRMGQSVPQNYIAAIKWLRKAADQGDADAQFELGQIYRKGKGVPQDYAESVGWYREAAEQGTGIINRHAQFVLGLMYWGGKGVAQDYVQAHMWLNLAAIHNQRLTIAQTMRDKVAEQLTPAEIAEAQRLAREWKPRGGEKKSSKTGATLRILKKKG